MTTRKKGRRKDGKQRKHIEGSSGRAATAGIAMADAIGSMAKGNYGFGVASFFRTLRGKKKNRPSRSKYIPYRPSTKTRWFNNSGMPIVLGSTTTQCKSLGNLPRKTKAKKI